MWDFARRRIMIMEISGLQNRNKNRGIIPFSFVGWIRGCERGFITFFCMIGNEGESWVVLLKADS